MPQSHLDQVNSAKGFAAIITLLVVLVIMVLIGMSVTLSSIGNAQMGLGYTKSENNLKLAETCIEDVLFKWNQTNILILSSTNPLGTCTITQDNLIGNQITFTVTSTSNNYTRNIQIVATRTTNVSVVSWKQIN
ncbi:MAG: hypothetical protein WCL07_02375 [bacterium]